MVWPQVVCGQTDACGHLLGSRALDQDPTLLRLQKDLAAPSSSKAMVNAVEGTSSNRARCDFTSKYWQNQKWFPFRPFTDHASRDDDYGQITCCDRAAGL